MLTLKGKAMLERSLLSFCFLIHPFISERPTITPSNQKKNDHPTLPLPPFPLHITLLFRNTLFFCFPRGTRPLHIKLGRDLQPHEGVQECRRVLRSDLPSWLGQNVHCDQVCQQRLAHMASQGRIPYPHLGR